jgi:trans-aconitate methyltransferase
MNAITLYNDIWSSTSELEARCKESLNPRGADMLYELFASFSPTAQSEIIDIGCRDASYAIELANRFGCRVFGIDPAPIHIARARKKTPRPGSQIGCAPSWPGSRRCRRPTDRST